MKFVFGYAGTRSSVANPPPAVKLAPLTVEMAPNNKSPLFVVLTFPLLGEVPVPCAVVPVSSELDVATPEYSKIAKCKLSEIVSDTVTVLAPPAMFCA